MSKEWYNKIAKRNGGYKSDAQYTREGLSGEDRFEELLKSMLPEYAKVLDMGCGHGEFTLKMAEYCNHITGADNAEELIKIANHLLTDSQATNAKFLLANTKGELPFEKDEFDLVYVRRGPTSIVENSWMLKPGGKLIGVYTFDLDKSSFIERLKDNGFVDVEFETFDQARYYYDIKEEFAKHQSSFHCSKDYTLESNQDELNNLIKENMYDNRLSWPENRYVFQATKK